MKTLTINIKDDEVVEKVTWMLEHFEKDGVEIISREDWEDYHLLRDSRKDDSISFNEYLKNAD